MKKKEVCCPACIVSNTFKAYEVDGCLALKCVKCGFLYKSTLKNTHSVPAKDRGNKK